MEIARYLFNGIFATIVHYAILYLNVEILENPSAALSNFIASIVGISFSFLGNKYFVFRKYETKTIEQFTKFAMLYASIAVLHGLTLLAWTDWLGFDYRLGFMIAAGIQMATSYVGNKFLVFN